MKKQNPTLNSFRLKNFKAVQDSGVVKFTPLTVFIGNNGSGKSSLVEGLETFQSIVVRGLDEAMWQWRGFENVWHKGVTHSPQKQAGIYPRHTNPMGFDLRYTMHGEKRVVRMDINLSPEENKPFSSEESKLFIEQELLESRRYRWERPAIGKTTGFWKDIPQTNHSWEEDHNTSILKSRTPPLHDNSDFISKWGFFSLNPENIGIPHPQRRTGGEARLQKDGSNIAEYLLDIKKADLSAFTGIVETLRYVLPYAEDLQPTLTTELERTVYLNLKERNYSVPGWLLSTGTLRILCLLALLRHPTPPPLIVIEEIENGLDPRTIHLIVEEIRRVVEDGKTQIILTTHSPYLLDLFDLSQIVLVERVDGQPTFTRPADQESLQEWSKKYGPGKLYTMDLLRRKEGQ